MAFLVPLLAGVGGGVAASALGAGTLGAIGTGVVTAAATGSLMNQGGSSTSAPAPAPTTATETQPTVPTPPPPPQPVTPIQPVTPFTYDYTNPYAFIGNTTAASGQKEAEAIRATASGPAEAAVADTATKGRRSTIATTPRGLLAEEEAPGILRQRRSLIGGGLIK